MFKRMIILMAVMLPVSGALAADTVNKEFTISPGGKLKLDLRTGGSIELTGWSRDSISVEAERSGKDGEHIDVEMDETDDGFRIRTSFKIRKKKMTVGLKLRIHLPEQYNVSVDSIGGGIVIENMEGEFTGETLGGPLILEDVKGFVKLKTFGGRVRLRNSEVDGSLSTLGGQVVFENVTGDVHGSSLGGDVVYKNVTFSHGEVSRITRNADDDEVVISTMGGQINVEEAPAGADVKTMGGDIWVREAAGFVKAKTMGGDIRIDEVDGWVRATTMAGNIEVTMVGDPGDGRREVDVESYQGEIEVIVPDGLDMDIDIELAYTKNSRRSFKIISDWDLELTESDEWDYDHGSPRKYIRGTGSAGSAENKIRIRTINGNVRLKRGG